MYPRKQIHGCITSGFYDLQSLCTVRVFAGVSFICCLFSVFFNLRQAMDDQWKKMTGLIFNVLLFRGHLCQGVLLYKLLFSFNIYHIWDTLLSVFLKKNIVVLFCLFNTYVDTQAWTDGRHCIRFLDVLASKYVKTNIFFSTSRLDSTLFGASCWDRLYV